MDDQLIGAFELPATVPILQNGKHRVSMYAGVIYNGISGTRGNYLFTKPRVYNSMELFIDSSALHTKTNIKSNNNPLMRMIHAHVKLLQGGSRHNAWTEPPDIIAGTGSSPLPIVLH